MKQTLIEHFNNDHETKIAKKKIREEGFSDHFLDELTKKYNWCEEVYPYAHLHKYYMYKLALDERSFVPPVFSKEPFEFRDSVEIVDNFFHKGKPNTKYLGEYVEQWILFFVTEGQFRCNHNKVLREFGKNRDNTNWLVWSTTLAQSTAANWRLVHSDMMYNQIIDITDTCNAVLSRLLKRLRRVPLTGAYLRAMFTNLQNLPEFVPFQQNRTHMHKEFRWYFERLKKGGNSGYHKAAKPVRLSKHSVHAMLVEYDEWLPSLRKRSKTKPVSK